MSWKLFKALDYFQHWWSCNLVSITGMVFHQQWGFPCEPEDILSLIHIPHFLSLSYLTSCDLLEGLIQVLKWNLEGLNGINLQGFLLPVLLCYSIFLFLPWFLLSCLRFLCWLNASCLEPDAFGCQFDLLATCSLVVSRSLLALISQLVGGPFFTGPVCHFLAPVKE